MAGSSKKARKESSDRNMIHVRSSRETAALEDTCSRLGARVEVPMMWEGKWGPLSEGQKNRGGQIRWVELATKGGRRIKLIPYRNIEIRLIHGWDKLVRRA
jgi:hypothetical protein